MFKNWTKWRSRVEKFTKKWSLAIYSHASGVRYRLRWRVIFIFWPRMTLYIQNIITKNLQLTRHAASVGVNNLYSQSSSKHFPVWSYRLFAIDQTFEAAFFYPRKLFFTNLTIRQKNLKFGVAEWTLQYVDSNWSPPIKKILKILIDRQVFKTAVHGYEENISFWQKYFWEILTVKSEVLKTLCF